jgi:serine/threonine protein kinase
MERFQTLERLAHRGQATVSRGVELATGRLVAIKEGERLSHEAAALTALASCPALPRVVAQGTGWLATTWLPGESLDHILQKGWLAPADAIRIMLGLLQSMQAVHELGWVHGDLCPANAVADAHSQGILDWGCAQHYSLPSHKDLLGTIHYMAPELFDEAAPSVQTDLYALGVTFYEMLTLQMPYEGDTRIQVIASHHLHVHKPMHEIRPEIPGTFQLWFEQMTARDPSKRFANAKSAGLALHEISR